MTPSDVARDCHDSYLVAIHALRQRALAEGAVVIPREDEPVDIILLAMLARRSEALP